VLRGHKSLQRGNATACARRLPKSFSAMPAPPLPCCAPRITRLPGPPSAASHRPPFKRVLPPTAGRNFPPHRAFYPAPTPRSQSPPSPPPLATRPPPRTPPSTGTPPRQPLPTPHHRPTSSMSLASPLLARRSHLLAVWEPSTLPRPVQRRAPYRHATAPPRARTPRGDRAQHVTLAPRATRPTGLGRFHRAQQATVLCEWAIFARAPQAMG
jgi:hypothetical protein